MARENQNFNERARRSTVDRQHGRGERDGNTVHFENGVRREINGEVASPSAWGGAGMAELRSVHHGGRTNMFHVDYHPDGTKVANYGSGGSVTTRPDGTVEGTPPKESW